MSVRQYRQVLVQRDMSVRQYRQIRVQRDMESVRQYRQVLVQHDMSDNTDKYWYNRTCQLDNTDKYWYNGTYQLDNTDKYGYNGTCQTIQTSTSTTWHVRQYRQVLVQRDMSDKVLVQPHMSVKRKTKYCYRDMLITINQNQSSSGRTGHVNK